MSLQYDTHRSPLTRFRLLLVLFALVGALPARILAQDNAARTADALAYIAAHADREEKVMIPMRDGVRLSALILFPKDRPRQNLPAVLFRSPYLIEPGEVHRFALYLRSFLENGYAAVIQNVRGRYFSEGTYTYLVGSGKDGYDTVEWITRQAWSNGKVGTLGCSSTAEEQHKLNGSQPPGLAATVPMGSGAGIGRVGPYNEMGNFYRGGVVQGFWFSWYYDAGYTYRPSFPPSSVARDPDPPRPLLEPAAGDDPAVGHRHAHLDPADQPDHGQDGSHAERHGRFREPAAQ